MKNKKITDRPAANDCSYEQIEIGKKFEFERIITQDDVERFAELTGDYNPLHTDKPYADKTDFKGTIVHGMLAASLFSTLVGMHCPGKRNLYLSQSLNFKKPIRPNTTLRVYGEVINKIDSVSMIIINTKAYCDGELAIDGEARVRLI